MAIYFLHVKLLTRGTGSSVTKAAAYRAGECVRDERSGAVYNYPKRADVARSKTLFSAIAGRVDMERAR